MRISTEVVKQLAEAVATTTKFVVNAIKSVRL